MTFPPFKSLWPCLAATAAAVGGKNCELGGWLYESSQWAPPGYHVWLGWVWSWLGLVIWEGLAQLDQDSTRIRSRHLVLTSVILICFDGWMDCSAPLAPPTSFAGFAFPTQTTLTAEQWSFGGVGIVMRKAAGKRRSKACYSIEKVGGECCSERQFITKISMTREVHLVYFCYFLIHGAFPKVKPFGSLLPLDKKPEQAEKTCKQLGA